MRRVFRLWRTNFYRRGVAAALAVAAPGHTAAVAPTEYDPRILAMKSELLERPVAALADARALIATSRSYSTPGAVLIAAEWVAATALLTLNRPQEAAEISSQALDQAKVLTESDPLRGELLLAHGRAQARLGNVQAALDDYQGAFRVFGLSHAARGQAISLQNIAVLYNEARDFQNGIKYSRESLDIYAREPLLVISALNNTAVSWYGLTDYKKSEQAFKRALSVAEPIRSDVINVRLLRNLADVQVKQQLFSIASSTLEAAFKLAQTGAAKTWRTELFGVEAELALGRGQIDKAAYAISIALASENSGESNPPELHRIAYRIFRQKGDWKRAFVQLETFHKLDDQSRALAASANAALLAARFDFTNQNLKIARLRAEKAEHEGELAHAQARYHTMVSVGLGAAAIIISSLLGIGFVSIRRSRNQVRAANDTLRLTNADLEKALDAKSEFLATTSHEIRTPLNGILGMTQVLLADRSIAVDLRSRVQLIHGAGETMRALVDDILDIAKMETGELRIYPAPMDLRRLLEDTVAVWSGQAESKRIELAINIAEAPHGIVADEVRLRQIVFNLLANAIKFTDCGGVGVIARAEDERLVIAVQDSGIGIPADRLDDIFEAFKQVDGGVTRRHGGTGLGLAICRNLAGAMGGTVTVSSVVGVGSTFTLSVPLVCAELDPAPLVGGDRTLALDLSSANLLVLEPNPLSQGIHRALLTPHVASLHLANDQASAREQLARGVDHLVADAGAFEGDPRRAIDFLRTVNAPHVTLLWPSPDHDLLALLCENGVDHVIAKPVAAAELLARLRMQYDGVPATCDLAA